MTIQDIEKYLSTNNYELEKHIVEEIEKKLKIAISNNDEDLANYCWCLKQIFFIKSSYLSVIDLLLNKKYEDAWLLLDNIDLAFCSLENNFDIKQNNDNFCLAFISDIIKEYQKLFPYKYFFSRESIIKNEKCSICGKRLSLRSSCGHKLDKLYMGQLCQKIITDMELKAIAIVTEPHDKYAFVKIKGLEYDYRILSELLNKINDPFKKFVVTQKSIKQEKYLKTKRNDLCPCGSGKKYKKCHFGSDDELMNFYQINILE